MVKVANLPWLFFFAHVSEQSPSQVSKTFTAVESRRKIIVIIGKHLFFYTQFHKHSVHNYFMDLSFFINHLKSHVSKNYKIKYSLSISIR